jgi:t-SNARE complex subunit (syntaxin)
MAGLPNQIGDSGNDGGKNQDNGGVAGKNLKDTSKENPGKPAENGDQASIVAKLTKENEDLRNTHGVLNQKIDKITNGLKGLFSEEDPKNQTKKPEEIIEGFSARLTSLESENKALKAEKIRNSVIDSLVDDKGEPFSDNIKRYLKTDLNIIETDEAKVKEIAIAKANSLVGLFGNSVNNNQSKGSADYRPEPKGSVSGGYKEALNANEILESLKK